MSFIQEKIKSRLPKYTEFPIHWGGYSMKFYTIHFSGWGEATFIAEDETLNDMVYIASETLIAFIKKYRANHAFSEPIFVWQPEKGFYVKISTMDMKEYKERIEKDANTCHGNIQK